MKKQFIYLAFALIGFILLGADTSYQAIRTDGSLSGEGSDDSPLGLSTTRKAGLGDTDVDGNGTVINTVDASNMAYIDNTSHTVKVGINDPTPDAELDVEGNMLLTGDMSSAGIMEITGVLNLKEDTPPSSNTDTGTKGEIRWSGQYLYICIATDTWIQFTGTTTF